MSAETEPTFEVVEAEAVEGQPHKLVYTRVKDPVTDFDLRTHALARAVDCERLAFRRIEDGVDPLDQIVATAERFYAFLNGGQS